MKNILKNKKVLIGIIVIIVLIVCLLLLFNKKDNKLQNVEDALENIFFYLPEEKYENINEISDYCKISLVYGNKYLKDDKYISSDDYTTEVKRSDKKAVKAYSKESILKAVQSLIGENATINFEPDETGDYQFTIEDGCGYNNKNIDLLSYSEINEQIYSYKTKKEKNSDLYIRWDTPEIENDTVTLTAEALLPVDNGDGSYMVYADSAMTLVAGRIEDGKNLESEIEKLYDTGSRKYVFTLKKVGDNYIWTNYEVLDYMFNNEVIID